jgi:hypothetical protein
MKNLLLTMLLLASSGCVIHEPSYQIIYTPDKPLTNSRVAFSVPLPVIGPQPSTGSGVEQQASR